MCECAETLHCAMVEIQRHQPGSQQDTAPGRWNVEYELRDCACVCSLVLQRRVSLKRHHGLLGTFWVFIKGSRLWVRHGPFVQA